MSSAITEDLPAMAQPAGGALEYRGATPPALPAGYVVVARRARRHLWVLVGICVLGAVLRFSFMGRPELWGDDAYTVYRTHADYQAMLDVLQYDGFTPLHYELYWLLGRAAGTVESPMWAGGPKIVHSTGLTPRVVRILPALWGTLMVPGVYFLAVQLLRRRTALAAALFAACSAYLLGYSRDGKMYMMQWCFSAWSAGTLLWWFRSGTRIAWLAWVASSLAMASSHMTGMALLPLEAVFFLTRRRVRWWESVLFVIGLAIAVLPPAGYITQFNRWAQEEVEDIGFEVEGLNWVVSYNAGRTGPDLVVNSVRAYLFSWETPNRRMPGTTPGWVVEVFTGLTGVVLGLCAVGMLPWRRGLPIADCPLPTEGALSNRQFAIGNRQFEFDEAPEPWWRVAFWLGAWMVVPAYFLYCRSVADFASPGDWWREAGEFLAGRGWRGADGAVGAGFWWTLGVTAAVVGAGVFFFRQVRLAVVWGLPVLGAAALAVAVLRGGGVSGTAAEEHGWVLAVMRPVLQWVDWVTDPVVLVGLAVLLPGVVVYYCGAEWRGRLIKVGQFALVVAALVGCCWLVYALVQAKFEKEVAEALTRTRRGAVGTPSSVEVAAARAYVERTEWQSIYMPRYMGFVWIAFGIGVCALLMRLPTRGLRYGAVGLLIVVNLGQFGARLFAGTEPPLAEVAKEIWRHDSHNPQADLTARVYVNDVMVAGPGHPGYGTLSGQQGKYYLGLERGEWLHPTLWKRVSSGQYFDIHGGRGGRRQGPLDYSSIAAEVRRSPGLRRVIVWEKYFNEKPPAADPLLPLLGEGWRRVGEPRDYNVRFHWTWADLYVYRRSEYVRGEAR